MINILYEPLPDSIQADGTEYKIVTDFREWVRFSDMMNDKELSSEEKAILLTEWLLTAPKSVTKELITAVIDFYKCKSLEYEYSHDEESEQKQAVKPPVFDWKIDGKFIIGDFRRYYGINLLDIKYMHWWEFKSLFSALPDDSQCCKRIAYRSADIGQIKNEAERKRIMRIKQAIAIPFEYDDEMIGAVFGEV